MPFTFAQPALLALLPLIAVVAGLIFWRGRSTQPAGIRYAYTNIAIPPTKSWRLKLRYALPWFRVVAAALVIVAMARPQSGRAEEIVNRDVVDIVLAVDMSGSMASLDFDPENRLEAAKQVMVEFIERREDDRIGLVVFANDAFIQSPPTIDHDVLTFLVNEVKLVPETGIKDGTAIGLGLANAGNMLRKSTAESRVIVLLTDGMNTTGEIDPLTAATAVGTLGMRVHTIGMGRPGNVYLPVQTDQGLGMVVQESEFDEETLQQIAETTGGRFFRAEDTATLRQVYDEIDALERSAVEVRIFSRFKDLFALALIPALIVLILDMLLRHTLFRQVP